MEGGLEKRWRDFKKRRRGFRKEMEGDLKKR